MASTTILRVCQQIHAEAVTVLYGNVFAFGLVHKRNILESSKHMRQSTWDIQQFADTYQPLVQTLLFFPCGSLIMPAIYIIPATFPQLQTMFPNIKEVYLRLPAQLIGAVDKANRLRASRAVNYYSLLLSIVSQDFMDMRRLDGLEIPDELYIVLFDQRLRGSACEARLRQDALELNDRFNRPSQDPQEDSKQMARLRNKAAKRLYLTTVPTE